MCSQSCLYCEHKCWPHIVIKDKLTLVKMLFQWSIQLFMLHLLPSLLRSIACIHCTCTCIYLISYFIVLLVLSSLAIIVYAHPWSKFFLTNVQCSYPFCTDYEIVILTPELARMSCNVSLPRLWGKHEIF